MIVRDFGEKDLFVISGFPYEQTCIVVRCVLLPRLVCKIGFIFLKIKYTRCTKLEESCRG